MEIKTKFNIGETVFYMDNNRVESDIIEIINIKKHLNEPFNVEQSSSYIEYIGRGKFTRKEPYIYRTKEELINSL